MGSDMVLFAFPWPVWWESGVGLEGIGERGWQLSYKAHTVIPQVRARSRPAVVSMEMRVTAENSSEVPCT